MTVRRVGVYAREPHHLAHIAPVYLELPVELQGRVIVPTGLVCDARRFGFDEITVVDDTVSVAPLAAGQTTIVSAWGSLRWLNGHPAVYMEHGTGQSYVDAPAHVSYTGAERRPGVRLFLCPNERTARINRRVHPEVPAVVVGCPYLDGFHTAPKRPRPERPTVAVSFHWGCKVSPEAAGALPHYVDWFTEWAADNRFDLIGHGHPRHAERCEAAWSAAGVEWVAAWSDVMERADIYAVDNSSTMYEFASLDRPVVALNAPWYRRHVHHGLRFWECIPGVQVDDGSEFADAVIEAWADPPEHQAVRAAVNDLLYPVRDGTAAATAAAAIVEHAAV